MPNILLVTIFAIFTGYCNGDTTISPWPLPVPLYGFGSGLYDNTLTYIARAYPYNEHHYSAAVNPYIGEWTDTPNTLPQNLSFIGIHHNSNVQVDNLIYFINPWLSPPANNGHELFIFNLETSEFSVGTQPLRYAPYGCAAYDSKRDLIYYFAESYTHGEMQVYDILTETWSEKEAAIFRDVRLGGCAMDAASDNLYYFAGYDSKINKNRNTITRYDAITDSWTKLDARLSMKREGLFCKLFTDDMIYCFGGRDDHYVDTNVVDIFDPDTEMVIDVMYMKYARSYPRVDVYEDCMIIAGGDGYLEPMNRTRRHINGDYVYDIEYFGDCSTFTGPYEHSCDCMETTVVESVGDNGDQCYSYSVNQCDGMSVDWIVLERPIRRNCRRSDIASAITSISPSRLTVDGDFDGDGSVGGGIKIDGVRGIDTFTICFDGSEVFGTVNDGSIGYKIGEVSYSCSAINTVPGLCASTRSDVVGVFGFDAHNDNEEPSLMVYVWSGLSAAFVSIMVVMIAYFCCIKAKEKSAIYKKVILDDVESDDE